MHRSGLVIVAAALVSLLLLPASAQALKCKRPPSLSLLYPGQNSTVPRNAAVYLTRYRWSSATDLKLLKLIDAKTKRAVAVRALQSKGSGLVRLVPKRPLAGGRTYVVQYAGQPEGLFRTSRQLRKTRTSKLGRGVKVRFGPVRRGKWIGVGRRASLALPAVAQRLRPAVVQIDVVRGKNRRSFGFSHARQINFADMGKCSRLGHMPKSGRYHLIVTPWSATGRRGRPRVLKGRIR